MLKEIFIIFCILVWITRSLESSTKSETLVEDSKISKSSIKFSKVSESFLFLSKFTKYPKSSEKLSIFSKSSNNFSKLLKSSINYATNKLLVKSLTQLLENYYIAEGSNLRFVTSVENKNLNELKDFLEAVLTSNKKFPYVIQEVKAFKPLKDTKRSNFFIIDSVESLEKIYEKLNERKFKIRKLVTILSLINLNEDEIQEIFDYFTDRLMVNINILNPKKNSVDLFTFFPFSNENPCGSTKPVKINSFNEKWQNKIFFYEKSKNLFGCPLKIGVAALSTEPGIIVTKHPNNTFDLSGVEKEIFDEFSKRLNFKADYQIFQSQVGVAYENGTGSGVLGKLVNDEIDVALGLISFQLNRVRVFSESWYYDMHKLSIVGEKDFVVI
jgi:hypothetical protein